MKSKKQSSVEWLISELQRRILIIESEPDGIVRTTMIDNFLVDIDEAKAMHKEEIIRAAAYHCYPTCESATIDAEQYYNETFNYEPNKCYHPLTERKHTSDTHFECTICGYNNY